MTKEVKVGKEDFTLEDNEAALVLAILELTKEIRRLVNK